MSKTMSKTNNTLELSLRDCADLLPILTEARIHAIQTMDRITDTNSCTRRLAVIRLNTANILMNRIFCEYEGLSS